MIQKKMLPNGFTYLEVRNKKAEAKIALQGAHIFHFQARGRPSLLWLSTLSRFEKNVAIRGGIPICFPWFGKLKNASTRPQHGFARTSMWELVQEEEIDENTTRIELALRSNDASKALWEYDFELRLTIIISEDLHLSMTVHNTDTQAFEITTALHSYFNLYKIQESRVEGLENCSYYDDLTQKQSTQTTALSIDQEVDRYYWDIPDKVSLINKNFTIELTQKGTRTMVVWNPWTDKSKHIMDMNNDAYRNMLCLETAQRGPDAQIVAPEESSTISVTIRMNPH